LETLDRILSLIQAKGITNKEFLEDLNLSLSTISEWKRERNKSYLKHINKIADYFNVSTDYLLGNTSTNSLPEDLQKLNAIYNKLPKEEKAQLMTYAEFLEQNNDKK